MVDQYLAGTLLAAVVGVMAAYALFFKRNGGRIEKDGVKTTTIIDGECRSRDGGGNDVDVIIVGAGVAGAALAHTLGKVKS